jgi:hypothetical protein
VRVGGFGVAGFGEREIGNRKQETENGIYEGNVYIVV